MASRSSRLPHPALVAVLGIVVGVVLVGLAVGDRTDDRALDDRGRETTGRIVDVTERRWPRDPWVKVEFTADGRTVVGTITPDRDTDPRVGREVRVRYDPRDPAGNVVDAREYSPGPSVILFLVAAVFLLGAPALAWFVIRPMRRRLADDPDLAARVERAHRAAEG